MIKSNKTTLRGNRAKQAVRCHVEGHPNCEVAKSADPPTRTQEKASWQKEIHGEDMCDRVRFPDGDEAWTARELAAKLDLEDEVRAVVGYEGDLDSCFCAYDPEPILALAKLTWTIDEDYCGDWIIAGPEL